MAIRRYANTWAEDEYRVTPRELAAYRLAALNFTNKIRAELGKEPIDDLVPGVISEAARCTVTMSIDGQADGLYPRTDYHFVDIFQNPAFNDDEIEWPDQGDFRNGKLLSKKRYPTLVKSIRVPQRVQDFLSAFDDGMYGDLMVDYVELPMPPQSDDA